MTQLAVISQNSAFALLTESLGLKATSQDAPDRLAAVISQSLRRTVFVNAPITVREALDITESCIGPLLPTQTNLRELLDSLLDRLIAMGDVLEMQDASNDSATYALRPAPPSFVMLDEDIIAVVGVAGFSISPPLEQNIQHMPSGLRIIRTRDERDIKEYLLSEGLIEIPKSNWLQSPRIEDPNAYLNKWRSKFSDDHAHVASSEGMQIIDAANSSRFYKGRWSDIQPNHNGHFVGRRPKAYGADFWTLFKIQNGRILDFIDIHPTTNRARSCDEAWRILSALDYISDTPTEVEIASSPKGKMLKFYSPIPGWVHRRLFAIGTAVDANKCLVAYEVPMAFFQEISAWLEDTLWVNMKYGEV